MSCGNGHDFGLAAEWLPQAEPVSFPDVKSTVTFPPEHQIVQTTVHSDHRMEAEAPSIAEYPWLQQERDDVEARQREEKENTRDDAQSEVMIQYPLLYEEKEMLEARRREEKQRKRDDPQLIWKVQSASFRAQMARKAANQYRELVMKSQDKHPCPDC